MTTGFGICPQCGTPLVPGLQFCGRCGLDVSAMAGSAPVAPPPWNAPVQPNVLYSEQAAAPPAAPPAWPGTPDQQYPPAYSGAPYQGAPTSGAPYPGAQYPGAQYPGAPYPGAYPGSPYPGAYGAPVGARSNTPMILAGLGLVLVLVAGVAAFVVISGNKGSVGAGPSASAASSTAPVATLSLEPTASPTPTIAEPTPTYLPPVPVPTGKFGAPTMGRLVYDLGHLLTTSEISTLEASAASIQSDFGCNVWMVTELAATSELSTSAKVQSDLSEIMSEWSSSLGSCYFITLIITDQPTTNVWWWSYSSSSKVDSTFWSGLSPAIQPYLKQADYYGVFNVIMTRFGQILAT
jgi:hypothetical protein